MNVIHIIIRGNKGFVLYELHFPLSQVLYVISHDNLYLVSLIVLDCPQIFFISNFMSKNEVSRHFLENAWKLMAEISYLDSSQHYLQLFYDTKLEKFHLHPF